MVRISVQDVVRQMSWCDLRHERFLVRKRFVHTNGSRVGVQEMTWVWLVCVCCEPKRWVRVGVEECDRVGQTVCVEACVDL